MKLAQYQEELLERVVPRLLRYSDRDVVRVHVLAIRDADVRSVLCHSEALRRLNGKVSQVRESSLCVRAFILGNDRIQVLEVLWLKKELMKFRE